MVGRTLSRGRFRHRHPVLESPLAETHHGGSGGPRAAKPLGAFAPPRGGGAGPIGAHTPPRETYATPRSETYATPRSETHATPRSRFGREAVERRAPVSERRAFSRSVPVRERPPRERFDREDPRPGADRPGWRTAPDPGVPPSPPGFERRTSALSAASPRRRLLASPGKPPQYRSHGDDSKPPRRSFEPTAAPTPRRSFEPAVAPTSRRSFDPQPSALTAASPRRRLDLRRREDDRYAAPQPPSPHRPGGDTHKSPLPFQRRRAPAQCEACEACEAKAEGSYVACPHCRREGCVECLDFRQCQNAACDKAHCGYCFEEGTLRDVQVGQCGEEFCFDCRFARCSADWERACDHCLRAIGIDPSVASLLQADKDGASGQQEKCDEDIRAANEENARLNEENEMLQEENEELHFKLSRLKSVFLEDQEDL